MSTSAKPYAEAPKDGTVFIAQYVAGLQFENRRTKYGGDHLGWLYEARPDEFELAPSGWTFQWWFPAQPTPPAVSGECLPVAKG